MGGPAAEAHGIRSGGVAPAPGRGMPGGWGGGLVEVTSLSPKWGTRRRLLLGILVSLIERLVRYARSDRSSAFDDDDVP